MPEFYAVIGANYGDEGKGLITDYLSSTLGQNCVVCRFNGGAQAGHTVVRQDGKRHVFSHIGSGTYNGCRTHLSKFFITNPPMLKKEYADLNFPCDITVDPSCLVTTVWDVALNQLAELSRGKNKHGSCGLGINETIERSKYIKLTVADLEDEKKLRRTLLNIQNSYFDKRRLELKIPAKLINDSMYHSVYRLDLCDKVISNCNWFLEHVDIVEDREALYSCPIVFEGAQGLRLDQNNMSEFPFLTRSNTGCTNVCDLLEEIGERHLKTVYVTRSYVTRHGNGNLRGEVLKEEYIRRHPKVLDNTNLYNRFQDHLRFAPFGSINIRPLVNRDQVQICDRNIFAKAFYSITCLDQVDHPLKKDFSFQSYGPTKEDIKVIG